MTVCGFQLSPSGGAFVWADGESYVGGAPAESVHKLAVSPAGVVGISTGYLDLASAFLSMLRTTLGGESVEDATARLPAMMRSARAAKKQRMGDLGLPYRVWQAFAIVGFCRGAAQAAVFEEAREFEPLELAAWSSPRVDVPANAAADVLCIAQTQIAILRKDISRATGGNLTIARIGRDGVVKTTVVRLLIGPEVASPPSAPSRSAGDWPARRYWSG